MYSPQDIPFDPELLDRVSHHSPPSSGAIVFDQMSMQAVPNRRHNDHNDHNDQWKGLKATNKENMLQRRQAKSLLAMVDSPTTRRTPDAKTVSISNTGSNVDSTTTLWDRWQSKIKMLGVLDISCTLQIRDTTQRATTDCDGIIWVGPCTLQDNPAGRLVKIDFYVAKIFYKTCDVVPYLLASVETC